MLISVLCIAIDERRHRTPSHEDTLYTDGQFTVRRHQFCDSSKLHGVSELKCKTGARRARRQASERDQFMITANQRRERLLGGSLDDAQEKPQAGDPGGSCLYGIAGVCGTSSGCSGTLVSGKCNGGSSNVCCVSHALDDAQEVDQAGRCFYPSWELLVCSHLCDSLAFLQMNS